MLCVSALHWRHIGSGAPSPPPRLLPPLAPAPSLSLHRSAPTTVSLSFLCLTSEVDRRSHDARDVLLVVLEAGLQMRRRVDRHASIRSHEFHSRRVLLLLLLCARRRAAHRQAGAPAVEHGRVGMPNGRSGRRRIGQRGDGRAVRGSHGNARARQRSQRQ